MAHKILIVDDEENILLVVKQALAGHCEVLTAANGQAALEVILRDKPDFVFLDISMPGMSGVAVLEKIRGLPARPVVWMLTGDEDLEMAAFTLKGGASGYLTKPFDVDRLRAVVFNALQDLEKGGEDDGSGDKPWRVKKGKK
ncbi:MAG: response regulator [Elusimicrobia bacterium]|nr:response regulator [Elusimicrobiota bacterium]MDA8244088.1 response regulator [Elusimicrobiota bacterium]